MKVLSYIPDFRIKAMNVMVEINILEYLRLAKVIIDKNEFQRKKVISSRLKTTLKKDIQKRCSIPPIILGVRDSQVPANFDFEKFNDNSSVKDFFFKNQLIILDGLQRTYVLLELFEDDPKGQWVNNIIRCEVFIGMEKLGILYRMLTLNTGQTTMSTRHLLEILYFDYQNSEIDGIKLVLDKDDSEIIDPYNEFRFKEIIEGYNSYIDGREVPIQRADILQNIETINSLERSDDEKDGFKVFLLTFHKLLLTFNKIYAFEFNPEEIQNTEFDINSSPFGRNVVQIFGKSQSLTGLGAALFHLKKYRDLTMEDVGRMLDSEEIEIIAESYQRLIKSFDFIRSKSNKVGNDQRFYFKQFYINLFDPHAESHLNMKLSVEQASIRIQERLDS